MDAITSQMKIIILGATGVGKSCITGRIVLGKFIAGQSSTPGAFYYDVSATVPNSQILAGGLPPPAGMDPTGTTTVPIAFWDTAGAEEFFSMSSMYFRGAEGCILVAAHGQPDSVAGAKLWCEQLRKDIPDAVVMLAVNKSDLPEADKISEAVVGGLVRDVQAVSATQVSALSGDGLAEALNDLVVACLRVRILHAREQLSETFTIPDVQQAKKPCQC